MDFDTLFYTLHQFVLHWYDHSRRIVQGVLPTSSCPEVRLSMQLPIANIQLNPKGMSFVAFLFVCPRDIRVRGGVVMHSIDVNTKRNDH